MNQDEKREVVERLVAQIKDAKAMIVTDYRGLTVTQTAEVRRALTEAGASFHVAKNTLARIAAEQAERPTLIEFLQGPTAIAFIEDDPAPAAKKLSEVARSLVEVASGHPLHVVLRHDMARSLAFYCDALGFEVPPDALQRDVAPLLLQFGYSPGAKP